MMGILPDVAKDLGISIPVAGHFIRMYGMNDATCIEEEQCLKHGMCEKVEHESHVAQTSFVWIH